MREGVLDGRKLARDLPRWACSVRRSHLAGRGRSCAPCTQTLQVHVPSHMKRGQNEFNCPAKLATGGPTWLLCCVVCEVWGERESGLAACRRFLTDIDCVRKKDCVCRRWVMFFKYKKIDQGTLMRSWAFSQLNTGPFLSLNKITKISAMIGFNVTEFFH